jgi:hyperosmotically inducible periplasmic protein
MRRIVPVVVLSTIVGVPSALAQQGGKSEAAGDAELTSRIKGALVDNDATQARRIHVSTRNGVVQLSGFVDSEEIQEAALLTARSVHGVKEVRNDLALRRDDHAQRPAVEDSVIAAKVRTKLARDADLPADSDVDVHVDNGVVQLSGFVASLDEKNRAWEAAVNVAGVKDVLDSIALEQR